MNQGRSDDQAGLPGIFAGLSRWHAGMAWGCAVLPWYCRENGLTASGFAFSVSLPVCFHSGYLCMEGRESSHVGDAYMHDKQLVAI